MGVMSKRTAVFACFVALSVSFAFMLVAATVHAAPRAPALPGNCAASQPPGTHGSLICGLCYDCSCTSDGVCPDTYGGGPGSVCISGDADCGTCGTPEVTPVLCSNSINDDPLQDLQTDYADTTGPLGNPDISVGASCNRCDIVADPYSCLALPGSVALPPIQGVAATSPNPSQTYVSGTAARPGNNVNLRLDPDGPGFAQSCWCAQCAAGYAFSGGSCRSGSEITTSTGTPLGNGCVDTTTSAVPFDNDGNGQANYNDAACSICSLAAVQMFGPAQGFSTTTTGTPGTVYVDRSGNTFDPVTSRRVSSTTGAVGACYAITCQPGYAFNVPSNTCLPASCSPLGSACSVNDDCGLYGSCSLLCVAGRCTAPPIANYNVSAAPLYVGTPVLSNVTSTNSGLTTRYYLDRDGAAGYEVQGGGQIVNNPLTYAARNIGLRTNGSIDWSGGNPVVSGNNAFVRVLNVYSAPTVSLTPSPASPITSGFPVTLTVTGSTDPLLSTPTSYQIDTNGNTAVYESQGPASGHAVSLGVLPAGSYTRFARVIDSNGRAATTSTVFTVNTAGPSVDNFSAVVTPQWLASSADFFINLSGTSLQTATVNYGDGSPVLNIPLGGANSMITTVNHVYTTCGAVYNPTITVVDSLGRTAGPAPLQNPPLTAACLPCVAGTQAGAPTYGNDPSTCCSTACNATVGPNWLCFAVNSCNAAGNICSPPPQSFQDRDTSQPLCGAGPTATCAQLNWTTFQATSTGACCGDDASESYAARLNGSAQGTFQAPSVAIDACCPGPNQCYTNAFNLSRGGSAQCFAVGNGENSPAACIDGNDNDCDGLLDEVDPDCGGTVGGVVTLHDLQRGNMPADKATVTLSSGSSVNVPAGVYAITAAPGTYQIYASQFGYAANVSTVTVVTGVTTTVDFVLEQRQCNADCTNSQGYCDRSCVGVGACQPSAAELQTLDACHPAGAPFGLAPGTEVIISNTSTTVTYGVCCTVPPDTRQAPAVRVTNPNADTLVKFTRSFNNGWQLVIQTW